MKTIFLILIILLFGCSESNQEEELNIPPELIGKWKQIEVFSTSGGDLGDWAPFDSGRAYDMWFKKDGTWISTDPTSPCIEGRYVISGDQMTILHNNSSLCVQVDPVTIERLTSNELIIDYNFWEPLKSKNLKVVE